MKFVLFQRKKGDSSQRVQSQRILVPHLAFCCMKMKPPSGVCVYGGEDALNLNKGSEPLAYCRVLVERVLVVMMWHIPLHVVLDVLQYSRLFALSFVRLPVCMSPRHGKQVFDS